MAGRTETGGKGAAGSREQLAAEADGITHGGRAGRAFVRDACSRSSVTRSVGERFQRGHTHQAWAEAPWRAQSPPPTCSQGPSSRALAQAERAGWRLRPPRPFRGVPSSPWARPGCLAAHVASSHDRDVMRPPSDASRSGVYHHLPSHVPPDHGEAAPARAHDPAPAPRRTRPRTASDAPGRPAAVLL